MVGGKLKNNIGIIVGWLYNHTKYLRVVFKALMRMMVEYVLDQSYNGAHVVQIFQGMGVIIKGDNNDYEQEVNMFEQWCMIFIGEYIDGGMDTKKNYVEALTTGMSQ